MRNTKLTIAPNGPGRMEPIFLPSACRPFPTPFATDFSPFVRELTATPIVVPTASKTAVTVKPYFLKISLILSLKGGPSSLSAICVLNLASSSSRSATLASAASLSEGEVSSFSITSLSSLFLLSSSASCSLRSSRGFVLLSPSSTVFLSLSFF